MKKEKNKFNSLHIRLFVLLAVIAVLLIISFVAPYIVPNDPYLTNLKSTKMAPCAEYPFGTDGYGRCVLSRVLIGARTSICVSLLLVAIVSVFGTVIGSVAGYFGGFIDSVLMRIVDILLAFPSIILAIAIAGVLGGGLTNAILAMAFTSWTQYARLARSQVLTVKENVYVQSARLSGNSNMRIMFRHLLPNVSGPLLVTATLHISGTMMGFAALSFLGLGVKVPQAEWGSMISEGRVFFANCSLDIITSWCSHDCCDYYF
jgi:peptide/nickel transport system permease protein